MNSKTIEFFKDICKIPRESGNEKEISNYICGFAKKRNLEYIQDKYNNVIIKKYDGNNSPIILQAHMDMVCEKENNLDFDFEKDIIEVDEKDGFLKANGTTLGADNGIGVAQILNILDSDLKLNIEAIFTVAEETTMLGAEKIDVSMLKGKQMINLDGFEEHTIVIESASFYDIVLKSNYNIKKSKLRNTYKISIVGMKGGHSGFDIDKEYGNSILELAKLVNNIKDIEIAEFNGGTKFNVIPSQAECIFKSDKKLDEISENIEKLKSNMIKKYGKVNIFLEKYKEKDKTISIDDSKLFIESLLSLKNGVFCKDTNNQVTTSLNLGVVNLSENLIKIGVRSSKKEEEKNILNYLKNYSLNNDYLFEILGSQPGFETNKDSALVKKLINAYEKTIEEKIKLKSVHITVESGFFKEKIPNLDVAIISPKIIGAHTTDERVEIKSINECDKWLKEFLC